ncbi:Hypothetical protein, putative [Bodo saltans]|uniref:MORN repeat-containing protein n=1 Tax=Bodo saltans TaxID=75058 RepID=A0A0S4J8K4_BODSA|nr:Hypothetical protein, putative [Bodo saltans]|eukprot:CUG87740.1 Hypothetical protein, putative [Bodo saltans]
MPPKKGKDEKKDEGPQEVVEETGTFIFPDHNDATYSGMIIKRDGVMMRNGKGSFTDVALTFEGEWKDDTMHGEGRLVFRDDGSSYEGQFVDGLFDGRGVYLWGNGSRYEGQWRLNRMHGEGQYTDADGVVWTGKFYNGTGPGLRKATTV